VDQRNIFPDLNFHVDRGGQQESLYSLFTRDPFNETQKEPRTSSTVTIANVAGYLQRLRETGKPPTSVNMSCTVI